MNYGTDLSLSGIGVAPYSARGLTQTLAPIQQAQNLRRTINGNLQDLSMSQFQKYESVITGDDQTPPVCDGVWPGRVVTVDCIAELAYVSGGPNKPVVPGSTRTEEGVTFYRPRLTMRVRLLNISRNEYGAQVGWNMELEEV